MLLTRQDKTRQDCIYRTSDTMVYKRTSQINIRHEYKQICTIYTIKQYKLKYKCHIKIKGNCYKNLTIFLRKVDIFL